MLYRLSAHAREELIRRSISSELLERVISNPDQILPNRLTRKIYQSKFTSENGTLMLLRVIVDEGDSPPAIITVYRTSKIAKYWSTS